VMMKFSSNDHLNISFRTCPLGLEGGVRCCYIHPTNKLFHLV
jgi:hypothetical protein